MNVRYIVELSVEEREKLEEMTRKSSCGARKLRRANILLMADAGFLNVNIAAALGGGTSTGYRTRRRYVEGGLEMALNEQARPGGSRKLDAKAEALLVATACSAPPQGRARWTLQLLADRLVALTDLEDVSAETIRRRLAEKEIKPWQKKMWCIPKFDADFVARMEDILDLYAQAPDPARPVVCFDETMKQLVSETRAPIPAKPGAPHKYDYEYRRAGTANLFVFLDRHRCWRHVKPTDRRTNSDFAECMRELVDEHYPDAPKVQLVLDNLSTHRPGALYKTFPPAEARRILSRIEFHYTPKHASWLNMVEIPDIETLKREAAAWEVARNAEAATINWLFDVDTARRRMPRAYPLNQSDSL